MHLEVMDWVRQWAPPGPVVGVDIGGRDINGHPAGLFHPESVWEVVDLHAGSRVTWVGDFLDYVGGPFDVALCLEVGEHCDTWRSLVDHAFHLLQRGGLFLFTAAGPLRGEHSAIDGGPLRPDEFYAPVTDAELAAAMNGSGFDATVVETDGHDVRAAGFRPW